MVSDALELGNTKNKQMADNIDHKELALQESWKAVGSPARRASINPDVPFDFNEFKANEFEERVRAASIPGFSFKVEKEGPPPPGFGDNSTTSGYPNPNWDSTKVSSLWGNDSHKDDAGVNLPESKDVYLTEEEYNAIPKSRSRSKSSSAIFGNPEDEHFDPRSIPDVNSIWGGGKALFHRRASTQPSQQSLVWEAMRAAQLATPNDMNGTETEQLMEKFRQEQSSSARRFSVAPSMVNRFMSRAVEPDPTIPQVSQNDGRRRHSMAGPMFDRKLNFKFLTEGLEALGLDDPTQQLEKIDDYFENTESRTKAFKEAGKNLLASQQISEESNEYSYHGCEHEWPVYVIEFKAGRTDYYYMPKGSNEMPLEVGELAIVEADRGKDLGKVIENALYSNEEMLQYQATHVDPLVDSHNAVGKLITPKKIYRRAEPSEVAMLLEKSQDEEKANALCQSKIRQKKLPMEIVDAEYQWDRRKLTFYFVAEKRIDFRELVRELFKIYKTRIWMCAVNPSSE